MMSPAGWRHGGVAAGIGTLLGQYIRTKNLGRCFGAETGFLLERDPDTVRAPDFAFLANEHLPKVEPAEAYWPGSPDLAVEVLSPGDTAGEISEKVEAWLTAGCLAVWVVDPKLKTVTVYQSPTNVQIVTANDILVGDPVVPGFTCGVSEVFR